MTRKQSNRRRYLRYLLGIAVSIGGLASAYLKFRGELFKKEMLTVEESTTALGRIPPGQYEVKQLRVLHVGDIPRFDPQSWTFEVFGVVDRPFKLTWHEFLALTKVESMSDFHCVTGWSKLDNRWSGVQFKTVGHMAQPRGSAEYATIICDGGYTTSLPLRELLDDDVIFAYELDGAILEPCFGGPLRLVVPKRYAYKSAKWVRKVKFTEQQELGYWELRGYSNTADPWTEDRHSM